MIGIFGAFGRTGRAVATQLRAAGRSVRLIARNPARAGEADAVVANLRDEGELVRALNGVQSVYALLPDDFSEPHFHAERRAMARALASAIRRTSVERAVLISSSAAALGEGLAADLSYLEGALLESPASITILRACYFQDNVLELRPIAERDGMYPNFFADRDAEIPTIAAADVGAIAARILLDPAPVRHEIVDLVGPVYTPSRMAAALAESIARPLSFVDVPAAQQEAMFQQAMSPEAARAMVATLSCLGSQRITLRGQRIEHGEVRLEQTLSLAPEARR